MSLSEREIVEKYISFYQRKHPKTIFSYEVRFQSKRIDLVQIPIQTQGKLGPAHALEFKIRHWRGGLRQTKENRIVFPYNSLVLWHKFLSRVNLNLLKEAGIGLVGVYENDLDIILKPRRSPYIQKNIYRRIRRKIKADYTKIETEGKEERINDKRLLQASV